MSLTRRIMANGAQLSLANVFARMFGILSIPLLTHWLSPAAYGQAALASTVISLVSVLGLMGMDMSYARAYPSRLIDNAVAVETFCWRFALTAAFLSGCFATLLWVIHARFDQSAMDGLAGWIFLGTSMSLLLAMAQTRSRLLERYGRLSIAVAVGGLAASVITILLSWKFVPDERALVSGYIVAFLVPLFIIGIPNFRQLFTSSGLKSEERWSIFLIGLPGTVTAPMYWVLTSSDRWFLQGYYSSATVGLYAVACTFGQLGLIANSALISIWLPEATRIHESNAPDGVHVLGTLMVRLFYMMGIVWVSVGMFGGDLLNYLVDESFRDAGVLIPWLASSIFFYGCYHIANTGLFLQKNLKWSAFAFAGVGIISTIGNFLFIPFYGMASAAIIQCISFAILAFIILIIAQCRNRFYLPYGRIIIAILIISCTLYFGTTFYSVSNFFNISFKIFLLIFVSISTLFFLEKSLLTKIIFAALSFCKIGKFR